MSKNKHAWVLAYGAAALGVLLLIVVAEVMLRPRITGGVRALAFMLAMVFIAWCAGVVPSFVLRRELRRRMDDLAKGEQRIRAVIDHVIDGIITINERGRVEAFNPAAERIFRYQAAEVIGHNISMLMPEPDHSRHDSYLANYLRTGEAKIIGIGREVTGRRKDGTTFPMDLAVSQFRLGPARFFVGMVRDLSERKQAASTFRFLAEVSASLSSLMDYGSTLQNVAALAVPFFADWCSVDLLQADGTLRRLAAAHMNPAKTELLHRLAPRQPLAADGLAGVANVLRTGRAELVAEVSPPPTDDRAGDREQAALWDEVGLRSYMCAPLVARKETLGVVTFALVQENRQYKPADLTLAEDVAGRAAVAIENASLYAELRDADRRKDEFLAMLAHELRNPLAPIRSGLDLLEMEGVDEETVKWARTMLKRQVQHMARLVDNLLDVSRIMRGKIQLRKEPVELAAVLQRSIETARPIIDAQGHELIVSLPSAPVWIEADLVRLSQVVGNLLNNAAKYNDKAGHIWLSAAREQDDAVIRVRDDGVGIAPETMPHIFELFMQVDQSIERSQGGLGIGLTLARNLVQMHGGVIQGLSEGRGKGSEFVVRLPARAAPQVEDAGEYPPAAEKAPDAKPYQRRILVVDDNADAARTLAELAHRWNYDVRIARDGAAALELAGEYHPDVVLLDIGLPKMSGYQVAMRLRQQPDFQKTLLVAMTGYGQDEDRRRSREAGFNLHLVKPVPPDVLQNLLSQPKLAG